MLSKTFVISAACAVAAVAVGMFAAGMLAADPPDRVVVKLPYEQHQARGHGSNTTITYHGGAVMTGAPVNVYIVYYGAVDGGTQDIVNQFFTDLSSSPEYAVNSTYYDAVPNYIAKTFRFVSLYEDNPPSQGTSVGSSTVPAILANAITGGHLPADSHGVYFVVTAPGMKVSGFCKSFCAYHTSTTISGTPIRYALVPDPGQACTGCDGNFFLGQNVTPNGNQGADEMTDSMIHELSESVTDPDLGAWYTSNGAENGDLCNYVYGSVSKAPNGAYYNFSAHGNNYLVQLIWSNIAPQACLAAPPK
ncbi:MAG TPA: hypothetical protein VGR73_21105 [Bryobacteraceae bacterium]|nr:hypothetical protein [Bryobacteraceae bacterium]